MYPDLSLKNYPGQSIPRIRRPPRRERRITVKAHATMRGKVAWQLLNTDGSVARSGAQSNMLLNRFLDTFGTTTTHDTNPVFTGIRTAFCVGTGSTAVSATQTTLVAEVARTTSDGGFSSETVLTYTTGNNLATYTGALARVITFSANYNLTEFGFSDSSTANAAINIRELFLDGLNNPTTVSVQSGQQLKMVHTLYIDLTFVTSAPYNINITNVGTFTGVGTFYAGSSYIDTLFRWVFNPTSTRRAFRVITAADAGSPTVYPTVGGDIVLTSNSAYTAGSYQRACSATFSTAMGNTTIYGFNIGQDVYTTAAGYKFVFTSPASFVKTSNYKLTVSFLISWGRAA